MLAAAKEYKFEIVPLVQTFGHLEWILKLNEFKHLRDDPLYPQVTCIGSEESWQIIMDMINQVAGVHKRFGMNYFHIGADEVFNFGTCNETINLIQKLGSRDKAFSWHVFRTANFVKKQFASDWVIDSPIHFR
uniref:Beta-N-acetylhexosaminidase n=1 Tax=Meloidogyne incognita TaxID=6306 RepID=A0A914N8Q5_MELIC